MIFPWFCVNFTKFHDLSIPGICFHEIPGFPWFFHVVTLKIPPKISFIYFLVGKAVNSVPSILYVAQTVICNTRCGIIGLNSSINDRFHIPVLKYVKHWLFFDRYWPQKSHKVLYCSKLRTFLVAYYHANDQGMKLSSWQGHSIPLFFSTVRVTFWWIW